MILLVLVALPAVFAVLTMITRHLRLVSAVLGAGCLAVELLVISMVPIGETLVLLGRPLALYQHEANIMGFCIALLAIGLLHSYWAPQGNRAPATTLAAVGMLMGAVIVRSPIVAGMFILAAVITMSSLLPSEEPRASMMAVRTLALLVFAGLLFLLAAWAVENTAGEIGLAFLPYLAGVGLIISLGIGLGVIPFHIWQPPLYHLGGSLAPILFGIALNAVLILRLRSLLATSVWPGGPGLMETMLQWGGLLSCLVASLLAAFQSSAGRSLAYAAIADLGVVLIGFGTGGLDNDIATMHLIYRALAITCASMGLGIVRRTLGGDTIEQLSGGFRRAPFAMVGILVGGLSLAGVPLTASLTTRISILQSLQHMPTSWTVALALSSIGPAWVFLRMLGASLSSQPVPAEGKEPLAAGLLVLLPSIALFILAVWPTVWNMIPGDWLGTLSSLALASGLL